MHILATPAADRPVIEVDQGNRALTSAPGDFERDEAHRLQPLGGRPPFGSRSEPNGEVRIRHPRGQSS